jgi:F-type H+-transporting ATPase subunit gamma
MAGLKEIRTRIASIKTTRQVTSAMKMVSAARLKKAQDQVLQNKPYLEKLLNVLQSISATCHQLGEFEFSKIRDPQRVVVVLISSNRGLCGAFNINIAKKAVELVDTKYNFQKQLEEVDFICIGKQGERLINMAGMNVIESYHELNDHLNRKEIYQLAEILIKRFISKEYDRIELVYNQFLSAGNQLNATEQFLPVEMEQPTNEGRYYDYIFEPGKEAIIQELIPKSLKLRLYHAILESYTAEQGARMTSMHMATDNANTLLKELNLQYNKLRQASITREISEIVGGAEALKGS